MSANVSPASSAMPAVGGLAASSRSQPLSAAFSDFLTPSKPSPAPSSAEDTPTSPSFHSLSWRLANAKAEAGEDESADNVVKSGEEQTAQSQQDALEAQASHVSQWEQNRPENGPDEERGGKSTAAGHRKRDEAAAPALPMPLQVPLQPQGKTAASGNEEASASAQQTTQGNETSKASVSAAVPSAIPAATVQPAASGVRAIVADADPSVSRPVSSSTQAAGMAGVVRASTPSKPDEKSSTKVSADTKAASGSTEPASETTSANLEENALGSGDDGAEAASQPRTPGPSSGPANARVAQGDPSRGDEKAQESQLSHHDADGKTTALPGTTLSGDAGLSGVTLAQAGNSLVSAIEATPSWTAYMTQALSQYAAPGSSSVQSLSIALQPAALGSVTANLHLSGGQLTIDVEVQTEEAHQRLSADADDIVKSLRSLGFDVSHVTVRQTPNGVTAPAPSNATGQTTNQMPNSASGQSGQGSGGNASGNRTGNGNGDFTLQATSSQQSVGGDSSRGLYI